MSLGQRLKKYVQQNKIGIIRETRFALIVFLWVGFYVWLMRNRWTQIEELQLQRSFSDSSETILSRFEERIQFWDGQAKKIAAFSALQPQNTVNIQKDSWAAIYDSHPEWLATYLVARRDGYEPSVTLALLSKQIKRWLPRETDAAVRWPDEAQSSAIQMASAKAVNKPLFIQPMRSLDKDNQWVQVLFNIKSSKPEWSFWVVHTFSEKILPELLEKKDQNHAALYFPKDRKFLFTENYSSLKIENSELISLLEKNKADPTGFAKQEFAVAKKPNWLSWKYSKPMEAAFISILSDKKIPQTGQRQTPSVFADWLLSLLWLAISAISLWWSYSKKMWFLSFADAPPKSAADPQTLLANLMNSKFRHRGRPDERHPLIDAEWEFCRQMLANSGPVGRVPLPKKAEVSIQVSPSKNYKGSWWIVETFDDNRVFIAAGDATGSGLSAAAAAYPIRQLILALLKNNNTERDTESFLSQLYTLCSAASAGVLLDGAHVSLFASIVDLSQQKICFLNAGYPAPLLRLSSKKSLCLMSYFDPIGMSDAGNPMPRWVSLSQKTSLTICNVGARNTDLDELEDCELVKIVIHPFGVNDQVKTVNIPEAA